jgi:hypothetical protein
VTAQFPKPWTLEQTGPTDCVVCDASGRKLFYIVGDEGDGDEEQPSILFWGDDAESSALLNQIKTLIEKAE